MVRKKDETRGYPVEPCMDFADIQNFHRKLAILCHSEAAWAKNDSWGSLSLAFRLAQKSFGLRLYEMEELDGVTANHFVFFIFRHAFEVSFDDAHGIGPVGFLMRKVGSPDQMIEVDPVT